MDVLPARSVNEAVVYVVLQECRACHGTDRDVTDELTASEGDAYIEYTAFCRRCQHIDRYRFRLPAVDPQEGERGVAYGAETPSTIIDAGQWLAFADRTARGYPAEPDGLSPAERADAALAMRAASEAVREVLKFIPAGEERVPSRAFWTAAGRAEFDRDPWRMSRLRLGVVAEAYEQASVRLAGDGPIWSRPAD